MFFTSSPENTLSASLVMSVFLAVLSPPAKFYHTSKARYVTFGCQNAIIRASHCCARHLSTSASFWWLHTFLYVSIVIGIMLVSPMIFTPPVNTFGGMTPITFFCKGNFFTAPQRSYQTFSGTEEVPYYAGYFVPKKTSRVQHYLVSCKGETLCSAQKRQVRRCFGSFRGSLL